MKLTLTIALSFLSLTSFGQKVRYLDSLYQRVDFKKEAKYFTVTTKENGMALVGTVKTYLLDSTLISEIRYSSLNSKRREGPARYFYKNGKLKTEITFKDDIIDGPLKTYYPNQRMKRAELYEKGSLRQGRCFSTTGRDTTFFDFQTEPKFPGGKEALERHIRGNLKNASLPKTADYPHAIAHLVIKSTGEISIKRVETDYRNEYRKEAIKKMILNMPKWIPGTDDGVLADKYVPLPIYFSGNN